MQIVLFYVTHPSKETADKIANACVKNKLAACANTFGISSCYEWENKIENDDEWVTIIKTTVDNISKLSAFIESEHPYEVPCIIHYKVNVNLAYGKWVESNVE